jgi:hypothetical protein
MMMMIVANPQENVRFQVLMVANMKMTAFWDIVLCTLVEVDSHFRGAYWRQYTSLKRWSTMRLNALHPRWLSSTQENIFKALTLLNNIKERETLCV